MPGGVGQDDGFSFGIVETLLGDKLAGVVEDFSFEPLTLGVLAFEIFGNLGGVGKRWWR